MPASRLLRLQFLLAFAAATVAYAQPHATSTPPVSLTPAIVVAGSPELLRIFAPDATSIDGEWLGHKLQFFPARDHRTWFALAGVDVEAPPAPSTLQIHIHLANNTTRDLTQTIEIHPAHYRTGVLTVSPKFVEPGPDEQKQIAADSEIKAKVFSTSAAEPLWSGSFLAPVVGRISMDLTTVDISDVPEAAARVGTYATVIGAHRSVDTVAAEAGTIGYEILTSLGARFERRYSRASAA